MRRSKPLAALAGVALLSLAACGGGSGNNEGGNTEPDETFEEAASGFAKNADAQGPAPEIPGAVTGGTLTVYVPGDPGPTTLDPTEGWSVLGNSIQQAWTNRSLTQYLMDPETGDMSLVPDLATDLGRPNEDFTEWTFTLRDGVKWENGQPVTAEEVAFGIERSLDSETFASGPGTEYSVHYFKDGDYGGPYTSKGAEYDGVTVSGNDITIKMSQPFADMDWWGSFMAMGPAPLGDASKPPAYGKKPWSTGPYKIESFRSGEELVLVKNDQWDPATDPARHQYADKIVVKFNQDQNKVDQIMLSGNADSQTAVVHSGINAANYTKLTETLGDRLVKQSAQCTSFMAPDYTKITDVRVRKALAWAIPYEDIWLAGGEIPNVTRIPANSVMPPGMAGKPDYFADGEQFTYDPERAKALLEEAGVEMPYKLTNVFYEPDPLAKDTQKALETGMKEAGFELTGIAIEVSPYDIWLNPDDTTNKKLNIRGVNWCSDWPSGLTMLPPLLKTDAAYNTSMFSEESVDAEMERISTLPLEEQPAAWGALDEKIGTEFFPLIPTSFRNEMMSYGEMVGGFKGDPSFGAPYYKALYVMQ